MYSNKVIIFVRGLPGAGKTILSKNISEKFGFVRIDPDSIPNLYKKSERKERLRKFDLCVKKTKEALQGNRSIVWDQPWRKISNIAKITFSLSKKYKFKALVIELKIPFEKSWNRSKNKFSSRRDFDEFIRKYKTYSLDLPYLELESKDSLGINLQKIKSFLEYNITHG